MVIHKFDTIVQQWWGGNVGDVPSNEIIQLGVEILDPTASMCDEGKGRWEQNQGFSLDFHFSIFPYWGMRKMNQFPLAEKDFPTNFQKITKMGMEI